MTNGASGQGLAGHAGSFAECAAPIGRIDSRAIAGRTNGNAWNCYRERDRTFRGSRAALPVTAMPRRAAPMAAFGLGPEPRLRTEPGTLEIAAVETGLPAASQGMVLGAERERVHALTFR
jgi:hypothetical protein